MKLNKRLMFRASIVSFLLTSISVFILTVINVPKLSLQEKSIPTASSPVPSLSEPDSIGINSNSGHVNLGIPGVNGNVHISAISIEATNKIAENLEEIIKRLPEGQIAYEVPPILFVGERSFVKVNLTKNLSADISRDLANYATVELLKVNSFMKADLVGNDFEIKPVNDTNQFLDSSNILQWEWVILPLESGQKDLILKVSARLKLSDATQELYTIKTIRKSIEVKNNPGYFLGHNWKWFIEIFTALGLGSLIGSSFNFLKNILRRKGKSSGSSVP